VTYLLDTDTCIYWLKGAESIRERLLNVGIESIAISVITVGELFFGAYNSAQVDKNLVQVHTFISQVSVVQLGLNALQLFGELKTYLRKQGKPLADFDLLIAATALIEKRILVTSNLRHYQHISGIQIENWHST